MTLREWIAFRARTAECREIETFRGLLMRYLPALLPCLLLVLLFAYDMDMALHAPGCASPEELGGWCLPLGWEGPFSDHWTNRSRQNAIIGASLNLGAGLSALGLGVFAAMRRSTSAHPVKTILQIQAALLLVLVLKSLMLSEPP